MLSTQQGQEDPAQQDQRAGLLVRAQHAGSLHRCGLQGCGKRETVSGQNGNQLQKGPQWSSPMASMPYVLPQ